MNTKLKSKPKSRSKGFFITFEGGEGSGKSTIIKMLSDKLTQNKTKFLLTREPGGTEISDQVRAILLNPKNSNMTAMSELFLYEAARAQHVIEKIKPTLDKGHLVICDRFTDSTVAYQSAGRNLKVKLIQDLNKIATQKIEPNLTVILDIDPKIGIARAKKITNASELRFENEKLAFHQKVRKAFKKLASGNKKKYLVIDASQSIEEVFMELTNGLKKKGIL